MITWTKILLAFALVQVLHLEFANGSLLMNGSYTTTSIPPPPTTPLAPGQIDACADIVFILDESEVLVPSGSAVNEWHDSWTEVKSYIISMITQYEIGQDHTRFAVIGFGSKGQVQVPLTASTDTSALQAAVNQMLLIGADPTMAARATADGLSVAYDHITQNQRSPQVPVYAIFISVYSDDVNGFLQISAAVQKLQQANVEMYLVPMKDYNWDTSFQNEIQLMTSSTSKEYDMGNYGDLAASPLARDLQNVLKDKAICGRRSADTLVFQQVDEKRMNEIERNVKQLVQPKKFRLNTVPRPAVAWPCAGYYADMAVLVDQSTSISSDTYLNKVVPFLKNLANDFGLSQTGTHMAMVRYSSPAETEMKFAFTFGQDPVAVGKTIDSMNYVAGSTFLETALNLTYSFVFTPEQGMRAADPKILRMAVVITDGLASDSSNPTTFPASSMLVTDKQVKIFAIATGPVKNPINLKLLTAQGDSVGYVFNIEDYQNFYSKATQIICHT